MTKHHPIRPPHGDDIAVWPNGIWASLDEVWNGEYDWLSDDYEIVLLEDAARQRARGIDLDDAPG